MSKLWNWRRPSSDEDPSSNRAEMEEEMRFHLDMKVQENIEAGLSPEDAHRLALRAFGNITLAKEDSRTMWGLRSGEILWKTIRFRVRQSRTRVLPEPGPAGR